MGTNIAQCFFRFCAFCEQKRPDSLWKNRCKSLDLLQISTKSPLCKANPPVVVQTAHSHAPRHTTVFSPFFLVPCTPPWFLRAPFFPPKRHTPPLLSLPLPLSLKGHGGPHRGGGPLQGPPLGWEHCPFLCTSTGTFRAQAEQTGLGALDAGGLYELHQRVEQQIAFTFSLKNGLE